MNPAPAYWKLLLLYVVLLGAIVVMNFMRENPATAFIDYFTSQLPKLLMVALAGTTLQFFLGRWLSKRRS